MTLPIPMSKPMSKPKDYSLPKPLNKKIVGQTEAALLKEIRLYLQRQSFFSRRMESSGKIQHTRSGHAVMIPSDMTGCPDIMIINKGVLFLAEVKISGGRLSQAQFSFLVDAQLSGAQCAIVCSLEGLVKFILFEQTELKIEELRVYA